MPKFARRDFARAFAGAALAGFAATNSAGVSARSMQSLRLRGYGPLVADPDGLLDLPEGFSYSVISQRGDIMDDGFQVPDKADGMGCFELSDGKLALVRNHELRVRDAERNAFAGARGPDDSVFDRDDRGHALSGGTTTLILDPATNQVERQHLSLSGTIRNCAGGVTPWGSWLTCEEDLTKAGDGVLRDHGWVFEVPAAATGLVDPVPLKAMGRFNHEAAAVDPHSGIVYLTEDRGDGLFYRFIPSVPCDLAQGGRLQALGFADDEQDLDTRNWEGDTFFKGSSRFTRWIDLDDVESPEDDLRKRGHGDGAAIFARGEGIIFGVGELYFCCSSGGATKNGQIMRYRPSRYEGQENEARAPGILQLFYESGDSDEFSYGDNLCIAPTGHLLVCEDQYTDVTANHLRGVTRQGEVYAFARIGIQTEPAGACFSPDGRTMFVNLYKPAKTLAIIGPWHSVG